MNEPLNCVLKANLLISLMIANNAVVLGTSFLLPFVMSQFIHLYSPTSQNKVMFVKKTNTVKKQNTVVKCCGKLHQAVTTNRVETLP